MGTNICYRPHPDNVLNEVGFEQDQPHEVTQIEKSVRIIQKNWKNFKISKTIKLKTIIDKLNHDSYQKKEILTTEVFYNYLSENTIQIEKKFGKEFKIEPEINNYNFLLQRKPVKLKDGSVYSGSWNDRGKKEGYGVLIDKDGSKFEGFWKNDKINGRGKFVESSGSFIYEGNFFNSKIQGKGTITLSDGTKYTGDWENNLQNGFGEEYFPDGITYIGQFKNGEKNGDGKLTWNDGSYYKGEFLNNVIHGKGVFLWSDGRSYDGFWVNGKMNGKGRFQWINGNFYEGDYKNDKKDGYGVFFKKGKKYEGYFFNGKQHGSGSIYINEELVLKGLWRFGKMIKKEFEIDNISQKPVRNSLDIDKNGLENEKKI